MGFGVPLKPLPDLFPVPCVGDWLEAFAVAALVDTDDDVPAVVRLLDAVGVAVVVCKRGMVVCVHGVHV